MTRTLSISIILASMLVLMFVAVDAQQGKGGGGAGDRDQQMDRDRSYDRDYSHDRDMDQDRDHTYDRDQDRDRDQAGGHDQDRDRIQDRDRLHATDPASLRDEDIYGNGLMSAEEKKQYRNQLMQMETVQAREQFQAQHEEEMQARAQKRGKDLVPPGQGPIYGGELMTVQERNQYREQLRHMDSDADREKFQAQHREQMEQRAKALQREIEEAE